MQFENYVYPQGGAPLIEAYDQAFESVFIVLHPFIRVPQPLGWSVIHRYPDDTEIFAHGSAYPWTEVVAQIGLGSCARLNQALLTSIGSLSAESADRASQNVLKEFLQTLPVWMPTEGDSTAPTPQVSGGLRSCRGRGVGLRPGVSHLPSGSPPSHCRSQGRFHTVSAIAALSWRRMLHSF